LFPGEFSVTASFGGVRHIFHDWNSLNGRSALHSASALLPTRDVAMSESDYEVDFPGSPLSDQVDDDSSQKGGEMDLEEDLEIDDLEEVMHAASDASPFTVIPVQDDSDEENGDSGDEGSPDFFDVPSEILATITQQAVLPLETIFRSGPRNPVFRNQTEYVCAYLIWSLGCSRDDSRKLVSAFNCRDPSERVRSGPTLMGIVQHAAPPALVSGF
jgi:hypothetical protein